MFRSRRCSIRLAVAFVAALAVSPISATEGGKLLPAGTDLILTLNIRQFLNDHQKTDLVQYYLDQWRPSVNKDTLGFDPIQEMDRITCGFKLGDGGTPILILEGKFQKEKLRAAVKQFAKVHDGMSFKAAKGGEFEVWQISETGDGINLCLLNAKTLALTSSKKAMDDLLTRTAGQNKDGLSSAMQTLLDKGEKEHVAVVVNRVDFLLKETAKIFQDAVAKPGNPKEGMAKLVVQQIASGIQTIAKEISTASFGLSLGQEELNLHLNLEMKSPKSAKELHTAINNAKFWAALALKATDHELAHKLADLLGKKQVSVKDALLTIQIGIPYTFLQKALKEGEAPNPLPGDPKNAKVGPPAAVLRHHLLEALTRQVTSIPLWGPLQPPPPGALEIEDVWNLAYRTDPKADYIRHRLDLFLPKGKKDFPVVVLVHGGAWIIGDNRCCGLYTSVGQFLASQGIGVVLPNYRLSPRVKHPEHVKDLAKAVAWTREHIAKYGGNPKRVFLLGHSAGGHLVSLLATDKAYLQAEGLKTADLQGVIAISGPYQIPAGLFQMTLGGSGLKAFGVDQMLPLRGDSTFSFNFPFPGIPATLDIYGPVFGGDLQDRKKASPLTHVRPGLPPFLILVAEKDLPTLSGMASKLHQALLHEGNEAQLRTMPKRNHNSLIFSVLRPEDPAAKAILEFIFKK